MSERELVSYETEKTIDTKRINPQVLQIIYLDEISSNLEEIKESLRREHIRGRIEERTLSANGKVQYLDLLVVYPRISYAVAILSNSGPDAVQFSLNIFDDWNILQINESITIDFTKANRRIDLIYYKCQAGETASLVVRGKY